MMSPDDDGPGDDAILDSALAGTLEVPKDVPVQKAPDAPVETPAQPDTTTDAPVGRDEKGRFTSKADEPAPAATPESPPDTAPSEPPAEPSQPTDDALASLPAYQYEVEGKAFTIEGSKVGTDGMFIPTDQIPYVGDLLVQGRRAQHISRTVAQEITKARTARQADLDNAQAEVEKAKAIIGEFDRMRQAAAQGDTEALLRWAENANQNWDALVAKAEAAALKKQLEQRDQRESEAQREARKADLAPKMEQNFQGQIREALSRPELKALGLDATRIERQARRVWDKIYREATDADLAKGFPKGEIVVDYGVIDDLVRDEAELVRKYRVPPAPKSEAPKNVVPPAVTSKQGPPPAQQKKIPVFTTAEEADEWAFNAKNWQ